MKTPSATIKSQLTALAGAVATINPQSAIARFIFGEVKGGEAKHDFAMTMVHGAIEQALKGNQRDIPEAVKLCTGKSIKARAYHAGFHVIADSVKPMTYTGKLADADNASVRNAIATTARSLSCEFEVAYLATIENAKVEAAFNRKAKAKTVPTVASDAPASNDDTVPAPAVEAVTVDIGTSVEAVVQAIGAGMLNAGELEMIRLALALVADTAPLAVAA